MSQCASMGARPSRNWGLRLGIAIGASFTRTFPMVSITCALGHSGLQNDIHGDSSRFPKRSQAFAGGRRKAALPPKRTSARAGGQRVALNKGGRRLNCRALSRAVTCQAPNSERGARPAQTTAMIQDARSPMLCVDSPDV